MALVTTVIGQGVPPRQLDMLTDVVSTASLHVHGQAGNDADETRHAAVRLLAVLCAPVLDLPTALPTTSAPEWDWTAAARVPLGDDKRPAIAVALFAPAPPASAAPPAPPPPAHQGFAHLK